MPSAEHLLILHKGVEVWNEWMSENPGITADLSAADLSSANLSGFDFSGANLAQSNLRYTDLTDATLSHAVLTDANLTGTKLINTRLRRANLTGARLNQVKSVGANFNKAYLGDAFIVQSSIVNGDFSEADLRGANFNRTELKSVDFYRAIFGWTTFVDMDLSFVKDISRTYHYGPSTIGVDTIYKSKGNIPESFLRGIGVPDNFIYYMGSLTGKAFEFYSCFISYSSINEIFAERLYADLQNKGVRCWYAPEDLKIGDKFRQRIDESIRIQDKLLVVLSNESISSSWVEEEVESALEREGIEKRPVLFPIRIDNAVMNTDKAWASSLRRTRHIGDFTEWESYGTYQRAFERLLRDLKAERSSSSRAPNKRIQRRPRSEFRMVNLSLTRRPGDTGRSAANDQYVTWRKTMSSIQKIKVDAGEVEVVDIPTMYKMCLTEVNP